MPDAFLRKVIEQRAREQELAQLYHHGVELPPDQPGTVARFRPPPDPVAPTLPAVLAEVPAMPEEITPPAPRTCSREGCENRLGPNNKSGICSPCQQKRPLTAQPPRMRVPKAKPATTPSPTSRSDFQAVTRALGFDPEALIDGFCEEWLAKLRAKVGGDL